MSRLFYENSVAYKGFLIIPFVFNQVGEHNIYSYKLLAEVGYASSLHKAENPAKTYGTSIEHIIAIAQEHIDRFKDVAKSDDGFALRYTYRNHLVVISEKDGKYLYSHYPPESLNNIAPPKLFNSQFECTSWIKQDLDASTVGSRVYG